MLLYAAMGVWRPHRWVVEAVVLMAALAGYPGLKGRPDEWLRCLPLPSPMQLPWYPHTEQGACLVHRSKVFPDQQYVLLVEKMEQANGCALLPRLLCVAHTIMPRCQGGAGLPEVDPRSHQASDHCPRKPS